MNTLKTEALRALVAAEIASNPVNRDGFDWCALSQLDIATKLGFSVATLRRIIAHPPFVRAYRKIDGTKLVLLREGKPGSETNYDIAQVMSSIWRKVIGKRTTLHQFHCLLGLAGEWPDGKQVTWFKLVLWDWQFFMTGVKYHIDLENIEAEVEGRQPEFFKRYFEHPSIPVIRRFAFVMNTIVSDHNEQVKTMLTEIAAVEAGKPIPTWTNAVNAEAWHSL